MRNNLISDRLYKISHLLVLERHLSSGIVVCLLSICKYVRVATNSNSCLVCNMGPPTKYIHRYC